VHMPGNFKMECFLQSKVCVEGDVPAVLYLGWRSANKWSSKNKGRGKMQIR